MDEITIKKLLGKRIRFYRKEMKLSQFALGEKIDMDQRQIAHIEGGNCFPSLPTLNKLVQFFGCELKDLFEFVEIPDDKILQYRIVEKLDKLDTKQLKLFYRILVAIEENNLVEM